MSHMQWVLPPPTTSTSLRGANINNQTLFLTDGHQYQVSLWVRSYNGTISMPQCLGSFGYGGLAGWAWATFQSGTDWVQVSSRFKQVGNSVGDVFFLITVSIRRKLALHNRILILSSVSSAQQTRNIPLESTTFNGLKYQRLPHKLYPQHSGMSNGKVR
jgi:hypothetical protein